MDMSTVMDKSTVTERLESLVRSLTASGSSVAELACKLARMFESHNVTPVQMSEHMDPLSSARCVVSQFVGAFDDAFVITDIGVVIRRYVQWTTQLPNVRLYYAVKCNPDPIIIRTLAMLGAGFDVASSGEIELVLSTLGSTWASQLIFANPCKGSRHIQRAMQLGVELMTFDSPDELYKTRVHHPSAKLLLRLYVDDITNSEQKLGSKFGCQMADVRSLLELASCLHLSCIGVSFHVGSGCRDCASHACAIKRAREVFAIASDIGCTMTVLDIGGGFAVCDSEEQSGDLHQFNETAQNITSAIQETFGDRPDLRVIAEPGRFIARSAQTMVVCVHSKKIARDTEASRSYYINASIYGLFSNMMFDNSRPVFELLRTQTGDRGPFRTVIFGETCDSLDVLVEGAILPELCIGDHLLVRNQGAYSMACSSTFNGFRQKPVRYVCTMA